MSLALTKLAAPTLTYEQYLAEGAVEGRYDIISGVRASQMFSLSATVVLAAVICRTRAPSALPPNW